MNSNTTTSRTPRDEKPDLRMEAKLTLNLPQISETRVATTLDAQNLLGLHSNYKRRSATLELSGKSNEGK